MKILQTVKTVSYTHLISDESPIGRAILGHRVGETVTVEAPAGEMRFTILAVSND